MVVSAFALMVPVLAGYIAFSIADRPGLTPGLIGGMLAVSTGSGFIGGIIAGFTAGYIAKLISTQLKLPQSMEALKPILIIPLISSLVVGLAMIYLIGKPVCWHSRRVDSLAADHGDCECGSAGGDPRWHDVY